MIGNVQDLRICVHSISQQRKKNKEKAVREIREAKYYCCGFKRGGGVGGLQGLTPHRMNHSHTHHFQKQQAVRNVNIAHRVATAVGERGSSTSYLHDIERKPKTKTNAIQNKNPFLFFQMYNQKQVRRSGSTLFLALTISRETSFLNPEFDDSLILIPHVLMMTKTNSGERERRSGDDRM